MHNIGGASLMAIEENGADYLRRLKVDVEQPLATPVQPPAAPAVADPPTASPNPAERRRSPRYKCEGSAEFRVGGTDVRTWGTFTDLSIRGCYIEMMATFPVGARVDLSLELNGIRAETQGEVRVSYPFLGMGIAFRETTEENQARLQAMVRSLLPTARVLEASPTGAIQKADSLLPLIVNPAAALQALVGFFENHTVMSQTEFVQTLRRSQSTNH